MVIAVYCSNSLPHKLLINITIRTCTDSTELDLSEMLAIDMDTVIARLIMSTTPIA